MTEQQYRTYVEIDYGVIRENAKKLKSRLSPGCRYMSVIKGNAYGHGIKETVSVLDSVTDWYAVATFDEAMDIRKAASTKPILVLGAVMEQELDTAAAEHITLAGLSEKYILDVNEYCRKQNITIDMHLEIDTGFNRTGITCRMDTVENICKKIIPLYKCSNVRVTGIYTHFPLVGSQIETEIAFTKQQYATYIALTNCLIDNGIDVGIRHVCNSKATVHNPEMHLDMVRVGAYIFGLASAADRELAGLQGAITWKARIIHLRTVPKGEGVGYNHLFIADRETKVAVVSAGFADGFRRNISLDERAYLLVHGQRVKIIGRICMDMLMIDVTDIESVKEGEYVTLAGADNMDCVDVYLLGKIIQGTAGEIPTGMTARVKRISKGLDV